FANARISWVPRKWNAEADALPARGGLRAAPGVRQRQDLVGPAKVERRSRRPRNQSAPCWLSAGPGHLRDRCPRRTSLPSSVAGSEPWLGRCGELSGELSRLCPAAEAARPSACGDARESAGSADPPHRVPDRAELRLNSLLNPAACRDRTI